MTPTRFRKLVFAYYEQEGRHDLPWRKTRDPYCILVSEIMLQQTQVERVVSFYNAFLKSFPTAKALASAPLSMVLAHWQGLGYNRRAKMLHEAAKIVTREYAGTLPTSVSALETLPGIGPYTARAIAAFAHNQDVVFVETNLRTAVMHHFFLGDAKVSDAEITTVLTNALPKGEARTWYSALMDYGAHLKRTGVRVNQKSAQYAKQSAFKGSGREIRGAILKALLVGTKTELYLAGMYGPDRRDQGRAQIAKLLHEGLIEKTGNRYRLPS